MNIKSFTVFGVGACALACVASLALPALLGSAAIGLGGLSLVFGGTQRRDLLLCLLIPAVLALGAAAYFFLKRRPATACTADGGCGCNRDVATSLQPASGGHDEIRHVPVGGST